MSGFYIFFLVISILKFVATLEPRGYGVSEIVPRLLNGRFSCVLLDLYLQMCLILSHPALTADIPESPSSDCWTVAVVTLQILQNTPRTLSGRREKETVTLTAGMFGGASSSYKFHLNKT